MKGILRLIICALALLVAGFATTAYADTTTDLQQWGWKDLSVGSNEHSFVKGDNGFALTSVLQNGLIASEDKTVLGGYAYYLYEKDLKDNDSYTVEFTVERHWLEDASNYAFYTVAFTDEPTLWYLSHASVLMQIFPTGGNLANGGSVRFIMRCVDDGIYFDVRMRVPFGAYKGDLSPNRVAIRFEWEKVDGDDVLAVYFNDTQITELIDGSGEDVEDVDTAITMFVSGMSSVYASFSQEYHGCPYEGDGVCKSVVTEICGERFDGYTKKAEEKGCGSLVGNAFYALPVIAAWLVAIPLIKKRQNA